MGTGGVVGCSVVGVGLAAAVGGRVGDVGGVGWGVGVGCGGPAWAPALLCIPSSSETALLKLSVLWVVLLVLLLVLLSFFLGFFFAQIEKRGWGVGLAGSMCEPLPD